MRCPDCHTPHAGLCAPCAGDRSFLVGLFIVACIAVSAALCFIPGVLR